MMNDEFGNGGDEGLRRKTLAALQIAAHATAIDKGWWRDCQGPDGRIDLDKARATIPEKIALIHSEASEALEDYRAANFETGLDPTLADKPRGLPTELADVIIRVLDLAGALGIDMQLEVERKMAYNKRRSYRHGGKRC